MDLEALPPGSQRTILNWGEGKSTDAPDESNELESSKQILDCFWSDRHFPICSNEQMLGQACKLQLQGFQRGTPTIQASQGL